MNKEQTLETEKHQEDKCERAGGSAQPSGWNREVLESEARSHTSNLVWLPGTKPCSPAAK